MIELFDNPLSPYARKIRLALYEKGLDFEKHELVRESQRDELLKVSPRGEVPALVDGGRALFDSAVVAAYLEDAYPQVPLLPAGPAERARCRRLEKISDTDVDVVGIIVFLIKFARPEVLEKFPHLAGAAQSMVGGMYAFLDRELTGREFLAGDAFSLAEAALLPHVTVLVFAGYAIEGDKPSLSGWFERMTERPSVQRDTADAVAAWEAFQKIDDPLFNSDHLHWRDHRVEGLIKVGLGPWLLEELEAGRAFLPPRLGAMS